MVAPSPSIVMSLAIGGSPFGPYQLLSTAVSGYRHPWPSCTVSGPAAALAFSIADTSEAVSPVVPEHAAVSGAARAGAAQSANATRLAATAPRHHGDTQTA